jgi:ABC-type multidrug transport system fused ATPase/permease subunit
LDIDPGAKVAVVGRTGAGKSTIATAFFRFLEAERGKIEIDGINIAEIGLEDLRSKLAIIPRIPLSLKVQP